MILSDYLKNIKKDINDAVEFAIEEHLSILNSEIKLPEKNDMVNELKLLATVKSREKVYINLSSLLDNPDISQAIKDKSAKKTLTGLKKTMEELIKKIVKRPMRVTANLSEEAGASGETSDDIISSISDSVKVGVDLLMLITDRIAILEDTDNYMKSKIENELIPSIAERYAKN